VDQSGIGSSARVVDCKGYNRVVTVQVDVKRGAGRDCPNNEESKKQENSSEQVTESNEVLVHLCFADGTSSLFLETARCFQDSVIRGIGSISFTRFVFGKGCDVRLEALLLIWC
jgi:hypothetical protein